MKLDDVMEARGGRRRLAGLTCKVASEARGRAVPFSLLRVYVPPIR